MTRTAKIGASPDWVDRVGRGFVACCFLVAGVFAYQGYSARDQSKPLPIVNAQQIAHKATSEKRAFAPIEEVQLGERLPGVNPLRDEVDDDLPEPNEATWRRVCLTMTKDNGRRLWLELLRPVSWLEAIDAIPGEVIYLDLPEMGAIGSANVTLIGPCPEIEPGEGNVVTGRFKHEADNNVVELQLDGEPSAIGVTANHPFWSIDRQEFIPAGELREAERVQGRRGYTTVVYVKPLEYQGFVYNLETHREHVYRVGTYATLVHNFCLHRIRTDTSGRVRAAFAHITPADLRTGTATNKATRVAARSLGNSTDDAGHLIGKLLGGPGGKKAGNFFPQNLSVNRGAFRDLEGYVASQVAAGKNVQVKVNLKYPGSSTRPSKIVYQVRVDGTTTPYTFLNP
jgi:hypothetical protein